MVVVPNKGGGGGGSRTSALLLRGSSTTRLSSRQQAFSISSERPPVILEWTSFLIRVGYAEQCKPQHIIPWTTDNTKHQHQHTPKSEKEWYNIVGPLLERIWNHMLLLSSATSSATSSSSSNTSTRRVVVLHPPYMERTWETAMYQGLWNLGVPGIVFINALEMVPIAMGWSRGMVIQVGMNETWCMAHVDGHGLTNTLQVVPSGYNKLAKEDGTVHTAWTKEMDMVWLDESNPESIILAVVKCLELSSMEVRKDVISNLVFCGDGMVLVPDLARRVVERLRNILDQTAEPLEGPTTTTSDLTLVQPSIHTLTPLFSAIRAVSTLPHRPDMVSWIGASLWSTVRHRYDDEDVYVDWTFAS